MGTSDFKIDGPITAERAQAATEWLVHNAATVAELKGSRDRAEYMVKVARAFGFQSAEGTAAARESAALTSDGYLEAIDAHVAAVVAHETILGKRRAAESLIDVWRSLNSSLRNAP